MPTLDFSEPMQSHSIIVIHPGSQNLRIGKASDVNPKLILHTVARRRKPQGIKYEDYLLPTANFGSEQIVREMEEARAQVCHTLQSCLQSSGVRRYASPHQQIVGFNKRVEPEVTNSNLTTYVKPESNVTAIFGDEVLHLDPSLEFNVHFPWKRGDLNIHDGPGGSLYAVLADLEAIWSYAISKKLDIPLSTLKNYRAVLIVPDIYNRLHLKELTRLLFRMGFGACFLVQDHVAATFGAGLSYACVVDVGDQKTSISCVEDAICHRNTRVRLNFGGADITQCFYWLLQKSYFPYKECNPTSRIHGFLLHSLKEIFCHVNLDICGSQEKKFVVRQPNKPTLQYTIQVGDEAIVAPLSLFTPELLGSTDPRGIHTQDSNPGDPEDPHDEHYLRETSRKKESQEQSGASEEQITDTVEEEIVVDNIENIGQTANKDFVLPPQQLLSLDQAILQSIDRCPGDDIKRKMYGCILIVGAGMKFRGIGKWLQNRISLQTPFMYRSEQFDIITNPKDMDPSMTTWKGAGIMSCLESARELWMFPAEFDKWGVKILRERAPFMW